MNEQQNTSVIILQKMGEAEKALAHRVIAELNLTGLRVKYEDSTKIFSFAQDRRVVAIPRTLIENNSWRDIRHLFRAILTEGGAIHNMGSPNEWGSGNH